MHVGGKVTHIAYAICLRNKLTHLVPHIGFTLLDMDHCLEKGMVRWVYFRINEYKILINNEVIHHFHLPNPERTNVQQRENWIYALEDQDETPYRPATPSTLEYHPLPLPSSDRTTAIYSFGPTRKWGRDCELTILRHEIAALQEEISDLRQRTEIDNATHTEAEDYLSQEILDLRRHLSEACASRPHKMHDPTYHSV